MTRTPRADRHEKKVYIAYTGGTIGMAPDAGGYRPRSGFLQEQMADMRVLRHPHMPRYDIFEYTPLIDSSNMTPAHWMAIARDIDARYDDYDGFIVLHGTDTMAYTASALSFMLQGLDKPVVLTGSQIPLFELRTDARENLINGLLIAGTTDLPEVCLFVGDRLLRGNRSTKVSARRFLAFDSPNYPHLGEVGLHLEIHEDRLFQPPAGESRVLVPMDGAKIADVRLFPGITADMLRHFLARPQLEGAVLHTYGSGNAPNDPAFLEVFREAIDQGLVIVNCTQCLEGAVNMKSYATGKALADAGVTSGFDMTPEAALTKLYWLCGQDLEPDEIRLRMGRDLRGELTLPEP